MNTWWRLSRIPVLAGLVLGNALGASAPRPEVTAAIQAIQQATDPSAAVAAYANGVAVDRNEPRLTEAYVARMVDLGLPELAYHQAQSLTTRDSNNGLAWGVVAFVNARRGQMSEAISAINLAGQFSPGNTFVQRTAGEIVAWYDVKADKSTLPANATQGLSRIRSLMQNQVAFSSAYDTARKAYASQASAAEPGAAVAPSPIPDGEAQMPGQQAPDEVSPLGLGYGAPVVGAPPPVYVHPDYYNYYSDWGPYWVQPAPWWWWQPVGFWGGFSFFPFSTVVVFDNDDFHHHHHHDGDGHHHDGAAHSGHQGLHHGDPAVWHHDPAGHTSFFGQPAKPASSVERWAQASAHLSTTSVSTSTTSSRSTSSAPMPSGSMIGGSARSMGNSQGFGQVPSSSRSSWMAAPSSRSSPAGASASSSGAWSPATRAWSRPSSGPWSVAPSGAGSGRSFQSAPSFAGPQMGMPMGGGGSPGGSMHGGGFSGGGFSGGGHGGGGGHR